MRLNTPVTDNEYHLQDGLTIVSTTDQQGNITYDLQAVARLALER